MIIGFFSRFFSTFSFSFTSHFFPIVLLFMLVTLIVMNITLAFKSAEKFSNIANVPDHLKIPVAKTIAQGRHPELGFRVMGHTFYNSQFGNMDSTANCDSLPDECFVQPLSVKTLKKVNARHNYLTKKECKCKNKLEHDRNMNFAYIGHELQGISNAIKTVRKTIS